MSEFVTVSESKTVTAHEIFNSYTNESNLKNNVITTVTGGVVSGIFAVVIAA